MTKPALLRASNITKSYAGVQALRGVSFELLAGEVHALVGENGAGKTTLIKSITGAIVPDHGEIRINDEPVRDNSPGRSKQLGVAAIYQEPTLFPDLSVAENMALESEQGSLWRPVDWKERRRRAAELLEQVGGRFEVERDAGSLTMPEQQLMEIARAVGADARILIMDEPTASLTEEETQNLYRVIHKLRERGAGIIYISHRLEELSVIADRVTVLRDGTVVGTYSMSEVGPPDLIRLMVGRELSAVFPKREVATGDVVLELKDFGNQSNGVAGINLTIRAGEIVGLAGLVGAGRTELARTILGLDPADAGEMSLRGKKVNVQSPGQAIEMGIAYLPEDRRHHGVIMDMAIAANITLASLRTLSSFGGLNFARERGIAADYVRRFSIKTPALFNQVATLSGGNQQKVALSRWLAVKPSVLILDEPTQGVDVGAKAEIHAVMSDLAAQGMAILMISSDMPEILGMSDRIVVMREGRIVGELDRSEANQESVLALALGHNEAG